MESLEVADRFVADLIEGVRAESPPLADDLSIGRFELGIALAPILQRWDVLGYVAAHSICSLDWIVERDYPPRLPNARSFSASLSGTAISIVGVGRRKQYQALRSLGYTAKRHLRRTLRSGSKSIDIPDGSVLFVEFFPNNLKATWPIAEQLRKRGESATWLATRPVVRDRLLESYQAEPSSVFLALDGRGRRSKASAHLLRAVARRVTQQTSGLRNPDPWLTRVVARKAEGIARKSQAWREAAQASLQASRPGVLVVSNPYEVTSRAMAYEGKRRGTPSVFVQHGAYGERWGYRFLDNELALVWGEYERSSLQEISAIRNVVSIGSTVHEELLATARALPVDATGLLNVLYLASHSNWHISHAEARAAAEMVCSAAGELVEEARFVYKLHPHDHTGVQSRIVRSTGLVELSQAADSRDLSRRADVVVVCDSTAGYEACVLGVPMIELDVGHRVQPVFYAATGAALAAKTVEDLVSGVRALMTDDSVRKALADGRARFASEMLAGGSAGAATRAAQQILALARRSPPLGGGVG